MPSVLIQNIGCMVSGDIQAPTIDAGLDLHRGRVDP